VVIMSAPSTIVTTPRPTTSNVPSGRTTAAVSSSMPTPSWAGLAATRASSRPNRLRWVKCWSTITPGSRPSP
jgi:hypothetical protein